LYKVYSDKCTLYFLHTFVGIRLYILDLIIPKWWKIVIYIYFEL
jgi:hypothetical protein